METLWRPMVRANWALAWSEENNKKRKTVYHDSSLTLALTKGKWACKRMVTCTGEYSYPEKSLQMRNFAPATCCKSSTSSSRWRGTVPLHNIYLHFSLGRWKEIVCHCNNAGGWWPVFWTGWTHQTTVERRRDAGLLRQGSGVPAQRLGSLVGGTSCGCWTAGCCCNGQQGKACDKISSLRAE